MKRRSLFFRIAAALLGLAGLAKSADAAVDRALQKPAPRKRKTFQCWLEYPERPGERLTMPKVEFTHLTHEEMRFFTNPYYTDHHTENVMTVWNGEERVQQVRDKHVVMWQETTERRDGLISTVIFRRCPPALPFTPDGTHWEAIKIPS